MEIKVKGQISESLYCLGDGIWACENISSFWEYIDEKVVSIDDGDDIKDLFFQKMRSEMKHFGCNAQNDREAPFLTVQMHL